MDTFGEALKNENEIKDCTFSIFNLIEIFIFISKMQNSNVVHNRETLLNIINVIIIKHIIYIHYLFSLSFV
jgi:hypothetical protein